jgi:hypothetical protein
MDVEAVAHVERDHQGRVRILRHGLRLRLAQLGPGGIAGCARRRAEGGQLHDEERQRGLAEALAPVLHQ